MADDPIIDSLNPFPKPDGDVDREARIRQRAFDLWQANGMPEGREMEHWLQAEREVLTAEPDPTMGTPIIAGEDIPAMRSPEADGLNTSEEPDALGRDRGKAPSAPKTAGAAMPGPDTSKSPIANRDLDGRRQAGTTPRPTEKPLG